MFSKWGARIGLLSQGRAVSQKKKNVADLSLLSESSLRGEMQGAGLTQTNQIQFRF